MYLTGVTLSNSINDMRPNWICTICCKRFGRRFNAVRHAKNIHAGKGELVPYHIYQQGFEPDTYTVAAHEELGLFKLTDVHTPDEDSHEELGLFKLTDVHTPDEESDVQQQPSSSDPQPLFDPSTMREIAEELHRRAVQQVADSLDPALAKDPLGMVLRVWASRELIKTFKTKPQSKPKESLILKVLQSKPKESLILKVLQSKPKESLILKVDANEEFWEDRTLLSRIRNMNKSISRKNSEGFAGNSMDEKVKYSEMKPSVDAQASWQKLKEGLTKKR